MRALVLISVLALCASCKRTHCYTCRVYNDKGETSNTYCGVTKSDIRKLEQTPQTDAQANPAEIECKKID